VADWYLMILISPNFIDNLWLQTNFQFISRPMTNATNAPTKPPRQVVKDETVKGQKISKGKFSCFHFSKETTKNFPNFCL
jgi:hypothetical protein